MADGGTFAGPMQSDSANYSPSDSGGFGSGLSFGGSAPSAPAPAPEAVGAPSNDLPVQPQPSFGQGLRNILPGPHYTAPDPQQSALDQTADTLTQRIARANQVATNPVLQFFNPEGVKAARDFVPAATEQLQKIRQQQAGMAANRQQAATLGLNPGEVPDEASMADRVEVAKSKALQGNLAVFKGLQLVDPKTAEAIQDQVSEVAGKHLGNAQLAFDSLSGMQNEGQYQAKLSQLRKDGTLTDLEALGLKTPASFDAFNAGKGAEGKALRDARMAVEGIRNKLEQRNTAQPMEKAEAETYKGAWKTVYGDAIEGQSSRIAATGARGNIIDGYDDPRKLGKGAVLATPEQRKSIKEDAELAVPKEDLEKFRGNNRTYKLATTDSNGKEIPAEGMLNSKGERVFLNTNPNVQQGIAEGLASALRGGQGGANVGLLKIETSKRGYIQGLLDSITTNYAGAINTISEKEVKPYLTKLTQKEQRDVLDFLHQYNAGDIPDRLATTAKRAGALGLDAAALGFGTKEAAGPVNDAIEEGRQAQIALDMQRHQAIGGGRGFLSYGALNPAAGAPQSGPPGTTPTTQLPGPGNQTPVQQALQPQPTPPKTPVPGSPQPSPAPSSTGPVPAPAGGGGAPITIAGQQVTAPMPPGASPGYVAKVQQFESGGSKDPWASKSGDPKSSASGAFQFINSTWAASKPPGAPARAADATPAQQAQAFATLTAKNAQGLTAAKLPVNDTTLYMAHNLGIGGATALLSASPTEDAKTVVPSGAGEATFRGKPTVATVLQRYQDKMNEAPANKEAGGATAEQPPTFMQRVSRVLSSGVRGGDEAKDKAAADVGNAAVEHAPAIGSTVGAVAGSAAGPAGTIAGGGAGGSAGQALKDYLQGNPQSPMKIAKEGALGAVLGVGGAARPVLSAAARTVGAGAVEGGAKAIEGGDASDVVDATVQGAGAGVAGETFGRALGMAGHKVFSMFAPESRKAVQGAAKAYSEAEATLAAEAPKLPGVGGAAGGPNPKFEAATAAKEKAEKVLKDAGLKPDEAAYAHKVASESVPKQEAEVARPGAVEQQRVGEGYQQLEKEVGDKGVGAPKASPKLADGPIAAVENKEVSAKHAELAQRTEMAITAPAANWQEKWVQLKDARSALLGAERDALTSTAPGRSQTAKDMRALADTVRTQQAKAAEHVFGKQDGEAFMARLKVLDVRYRNLMEATNGGDLAKAAVLKGEPGREAQRKFEAFAHDDPQAITAYRAMRGAKGDLAEATVPWTVAAEGLPVVGKVVKVAKLAGILREWARERTAGSPVKFSDLVKTDQGSAGVGQTVRDLGGTAVQRGMVQ